MKTKEDNKVNGTMLARHLIQLFMPGEAMPERHIKLEWNFVREYLTISTSSYLLHI